NGVALLYESMGQYEKALPFFLEILTNTEKLFGKEHSEYGISLNNLAALYRLIGQYEKALPLYLEALTNTEKSLGKDHSEYGIRLNGVALLYESMGQYEKALPLYLEALTNTEKSLGKDHSFYGTYLNNLAGLHESMGQYEKALPLYIEALTNTEKSMGKDHSSYGISLNNLAVLYKSMGQYEKALPFYLKALTNTEKSLGKDHSEYGIRLNNLALLYESMGQYEKALPLYLEALTNTEKSMGKEHSSYGFRLNNLAGLYKSIGQYEKALPLYLEALTNTEKSLGKEHSSYGIRLNNLALLYECMGQYDKALPLFLEALTNTEKSLGKDHSEYGISLNNLAGLYESTGQYEKALPLYLEALTNTEKSLGKNHSEYGISLNGLAGLYESIGQYEKALPLYLEALTNTEKSLGKDHSSYGIRLNNLSALYTSIGQYERALPLNLEAKKLIINNIDKNFSFLSEKEKEAYLKTVFFNFKIYLSFFEKYKTIEPSLSGQAFDIELTFKGLILNSNIQVKESIQQSGDVSAIKTYQEWMNVKSVLSKQYSIAIKDRRTDIETLEEQANNLEAALTKISSSFKKTETSLKTKWEDVQKTLKENEAAIEFSSFDYNNGKDWTDSILYVALVIRKKDIYPQMITLFEQKQLEQLWEKKSGNDNNFVSMLYRGAKTVTTADQPTYEKQLYELLWEPLGSFLKDVKTVYYSPSGLLHQIAFSAIPINDSVLLSDVHQLHQLSTTAQLVNKITEQVSPAASIVLFGGIEYDTEPDLMLVNAGKVTTENEQLLASRSLPCDLERSGGWNYLPGTLKETDAISKLSQSKKITTTYYKGNEALEESIKSLTGKSSPQILHISTHGFFFPDPKKDYNEMNTFSEGKEKVYRQSDNPLNRSGLLFSGANNAWSGKDVPQELEDGILTAYEVSNMYLPNTRLVVLSACETGLGDIKGSEGVFGLQRAFKMAGVEYIIMSLWKVPDNETAEFMEIFYTCLFSGTTIPEAFNFTQKQMKTKYKNDPYKWAAFVLVK
ncbi:MAG: tetratricopeptide repeat protein, partial [Bacteroidetes bacterium]|nr:tetratricopeptide repeat protein [Bacteroidota bacterium]